MVCFLSNAHADDDLAHPPSDETENATKRSCRGPVRLPRRSRLTYSLTRRHHRAHANHPGEGHDDAPNALVVCWQPSGLPFGRVSRNARPGVASSGGHQRRRTYNAPGDPGAAVRGVVDEVGSDGGRGADPGSGLATPSMPRLPVRLCSRSSIRIRTALALMRSSWCTWLPRRRCTRSTPKAPLPPSPRSTGTASTTAARFPGATACSRRLCRP